MIQSQIRANNAEPLPKEKPGTTPTKTPSRPSRGKPARREETKPVTPKSPCRPQPGKPGCDVGRSQLSIMAKPPASLAA